MKEKLKAFRRRITLKQLRALTAVVETGTVTGAATRLSVTPPAVTQQLRQLEDTVGVPLLERTPQGLRPTVAGAEVLATANRVELALLECGEALEALGGIDTGRVSVAVVSTAKYFVPMVLAEFLRIHPKVEIRLQIGNRETMIAALRNFESDFAVTGRPPEDLELESAVIGDHPHIIIAAPDHPLAARKGMDFASLAGETFLLREHGSGTRLLMKRLFSSAGLNPDLGMELGSNETIKQAVMANLGIALISAHTVAAELQDGRLASLDVSGLPVIRQWFVVRQKEKRLLPAPQTLWDFFATRGAVLLAELAGSAAGVSKQATG